MCVCVCSRKYICLDVAREEYVDLFAHAEMYLSLLMAGIRSSCEKYWSCPKLSLLSRNEPEV